MRRIVLILCVLVAALPAIVTAQSVERKVTAGSGRYSLTAPDDWVISNEPLWGNFQSIFPLESIVIADSDATLDVLRVQNIDLFSPPPGFTMQGALIAGTVWPQALVESVGLSPETFRTLIMSSAGENITEEPFAHPNLRGSKLTISEDNDNVIILLLSDKSGNLMLLIALADAANLQTANSVLDSLEYQLFSGQLLLDTKGETIPVAVAPDLIEVDIPLGWWVLSAEGTVILMPSVDASLIEALTEQNFEASNGMFIMAMQQDKSEFPPEAYNADGELDPDTIVALLGLANILGSDEADLGGVEEVSAWSNENGLRGLQMTMRVPEAQGLSAQVIIIDTGDELTLLISAGATSTAASYAETTSAVFESARLVD